MITLRAIPLSFHILWQYLIVFPLVIIGLLGLSWLTVLASYDVLVLFLNHPQQEFRILMGEYIISFMVVILIAAIYTFPMLVGLRLGLSSLGHKPKVNYWQLIIPAAGYGILVGIGTGLIALTGLSYYLNSISLTLADLIVLYENATYDYLARNVFSNLSLMADISIIGWLIFTAFYTALLVPLASVAIGQDPSGNPHTPFAGFGAGFVPLLALVIICYIVSEYSFHALQFVATILGLDDQFSGTVLILNLMANQHIPFHFTWEIGVVLFASFTFWLWTICILCAGATLVYIRRFEKHRTEQAEKFKVERLAPQEARALWRDRMPTPPVE